MTITTVAAHNQAQGICNFASGTFTGDGNVTDVICGFRPRHVHLVNLTDRIEQVWMESMAATHTLNRAADGAGTDNTGTLIAAKGGGATDTFRGFEVAAAAAVNAKVYHWAAWG